LGEIKNEIFEYEFGNFPNAESTVTDAKFLESQKLMGKIYQSYSALLSGLGGRQSLASLPAEKMASIKEQFENLKELMRSMLTFRSRLQGNNDNREDIEAG